MSRKKIAGLFLAICLVTTPQLSVHAAKDITKAQVSGFSYETKYEGKPVKFPNLTVQIGKTVLKKKTDYKVRYKKNDKHGTAVMRIWGIGDYTGLIEIEFDITR